MVQITLPDGSQRSFEQPPTVFDVAASIGAGLAKAALGGKVAAPGAALSAGALVDTSFAIESDSQLSIITAKDADGLEMIRHSTAHLLAYAVKELFPDAQVTIGPVIEHGFYYDFSYKRPFTPEDLAAIEKKMTELASKDEKVTRRVLPRDEPRRRRRGGGHLRGGAQETGWSPPFDTWRRRSSARRSTRGPRSSRSIQSRFPSRISIDRSRSTPAAAATRYRPVSRCRSTGTSGIRS